MESQDDHASQNNGPRLFFPIELVGYVLEHAARATLSTEPTFAFGLQLVSRTTRAWLLPVIYEVLVVQWPCIGHLTTPSFDFLLRIATEPPTHPIRRHIRHIAFCARTEESNMSARATVKTSGWLLDSVACDETNFVSLIEPLNLRPRRLFFGHRCGYIAVGVGAMIRQHLPESEDLRENWPITELVDDVQTSWRYRSDGIDDDHFYNFIDEAYDLEQTIPRIITTKSCPDIHVRIALDVDGVLAERTAINLVTALLQFPGVWVTLYPAPRTGLECNTAPTMSDDHTEVVTPTSSERILRDPTLTFGQHERLKIVRADPVDRPNSSIEYAAAIRYGISSD